MRRLWLAVVLLTMACADEIPEEVSEQMEAARAANDTTTDTMAAQPDLDRLLRTAPPGGHAAWIRDIRVGLDSVAAGVALDRGEALFTVQELYTRRFKPLAAFYGPEGVVDVGAGVARSVAQAGAQLQELMRQLATDTAAAESIETGVRSTQASLDSLAAATRAAGLAPDAPRNVITTTE